MTSSVIFHFTRAVKMSALNFKDTHRENFKDTHREKAP